MIQYFVQVKSYEDQSVVKELPAASESAAVKMANGIDLNLDHDKFYTEVVEKGE